MRVLTLAAAALLLFGVGMGAGYFLRRDNGESGASAVGASTKSVSESHRGFSSSQNDSNAGHTVHPAFDPTQWKTRWTAALSLPKGRRGVELRRMADYFDETMIKEALGTVDGLPSDDKKIVQGILLSAWARQNVPAAIAMAKTLDPGGTSLLQSTIMGASQNDPLQALAAIAQLPADKQRGMRAYAIQELAKTDIAQAINLYNQLSPRERIQSSYAIGSAIAEKDPKAALDWARSLGSARERSNVSRTVFSAWASQDLPAATAAWESLGNTKDQSQAAYSIASVMTARDPQQAVAWAEKISDRRVSQNAMQAVLNSWAQQDPAAAQEYLLNMPPSSLRETAISSMINVMGWQDPAAAAALAAQLPPSQSRFQAMSQISYQLSNEDPAAALTYVLKNLNADEQSSALSNTAHSLGEQKGADGLALLDSVPEGQRQSAVNSYLSGWAQNDASAVWNYASQLPDGAAKNQAYLAAVSALAGSNPTDAVSRLSQLPDGPIRNQAAASIASTWAYVDPNGVASWLQSQPVGATRDSAVQSFSNQIVAYDPETAVTWAETIGNDSERNQVVQQTVRRWMNTDRAAAQAWVAQSNLPADQKKALTGH